MDRTVVYFGGNGHAAVRLDAARVALEARRPGVTLADLPYPGFEGRPRAETLEAFLDDLERALQAIAPSAAVASGIGALIALGLRARGGLRVPLIAHNPVLWGLEQRRFPRVLRRMPPARKLLKRAFTFRWFQDRFVRTHFLTPIDESTRRRFFEGYARCAAFDDFFGWFTPDWLRSLEARFAAHPEGLADLTLWLGGRDHVVGPLEVHATEQALRTSLTVVEFPGWGHYPTIDVPEEWADALCDALDGP